MCGVVPLKKSLQRGRGRGWKSFFYPLTPECQVHRIGKEPFLSWPSPPRQFHRFPVFGCCPSKAIFHPPLAPRLPPSLHLPQRESGSGATQAVFLTPKEGGGFSVQVAVHTFCPLLRSRGESFMASLFSPSFDSSFFDPLLSQVSADRC